ncbi:sigma-54 dependent transcriptional regulator [Aquipseudomonas ullengensis]|uniref:Sigma-54-dependent Fis family transcriptional regulator n=1 Tax=Aquipseudomonas ullengensis TaxID=2759166 RepID=A0A7W4QDM7_9GAMM|nr:sigma-54 dependent transcriptional regulator [Pseudomonas ullengensis]MBB2496216.1 sigma-54-dependent Fis family transcriptional regulator [Pseudomonas ullengensis]
MLQAVAAAPRRLLVVDPCHECERLLPCLQASGWMVHSCGLEEVGEVLCDVGLIRLRAPHLERPETLKQLISQSGTEWIAVLSSEALQQPEIGNFIGEWFFDYHTLPFDVDRVSVALGRAFGMARLRGKGSDVGDEHPHELLGSSRSIRELCRLLSKLAPTEAPVLIRGESGTGKELVAHTLHRLSRRAGEPFVAVNCGAIPEHLIQSEMFGHEKGAFTGAHQRKIGRIESADGGTLFLDEIGDLPLELQANLLRFLQEMQIERVGSSKPISVNVRVLAATHIDLEAAIRQGRFREDLYYRLNVLQVQTTPLCERTVDIRCLAEYFARRYAVEIGRRPRSFSERAVRAMIEHPWPGNVRELANRVRRGMVLAEGRQIEAADLGMEVSEVAIPLLGTLDDYICRAEQQALSDVLLHYSKNMSQAARVLGVSRPTFYRLLHKHRIR